MTQKILIVVSSHENWPAANRQTGYWIGEVSHFCEVVEAAGFEYDVVSPQGGASPMDRHSVRGFQSWDGGYGAYQRNPGLQTKLEATLRPDQVRADDYAAIYYAGGHGAMWDFPGNQPLAKLTAAMYERGKVVAAVCHGVTGLLDVRLSDGSYLLAGRRVTGFANVEEKMMGLGSKVPFLTESMMRERGGEYIRGLPFMSHVIASERLVTGQNPRSTKAVARKVVALLSAQAAQAA